MAGKYRALLIGNSTYPADEHNLQPLKGLGMSSWIDGDTSHFLLRLTTE